MSQLPWKLYSQLAQWWPLLSDPADYREEAQFVYELLKSAVEGPFESMLELGAGGGNLASHLKSRVRMTLTDWSPDMVAVSRSLNPQCEHVVADMRHARLGRQFDTVLIYDAIMYVTTQRELEQTLETAWLHCRPGGSALFVPDFVRETLKENTSHGGHDGGDRSLRYLEWVCDPDPTDTQYDVFYAFLLKERSSRWVESDRHTLGLFSRHDWLRMLSDVGFDSKIVNDPWSRDIFLCKKRE